MANAWLYSLGSVFIVSLISFVGLFTVLMKERTLEKLLLYLVSFSAGALSETIFLRPFHKYIKLPF